MKKKSILFYYELFFIGGTEHAILEIVKKLHKDYDITVAYDNEDTVHTVLDLIEKYAKVINLNEINIVNVDICILCSQGKQIVFKEFADKVIAKKYFSWNHSLIFLTCPKLEYDKEFRNNVQKFICVSEVVKQDIVHKYPDLEDKCIVVNNYLDREEIIQKANEENDLVLDKNKLNLISVSRLAEDKRF